MLVLNKIPMKTVKIEKTELSTISYEVILLFIISVLLTLIINMRLLSDFVANRNQYVYSIVSSELEDKTSSFLTSIDSFPLTPTIVTMLLWGIVGAIAYFITFFIVRSTSEVKTTIDISSLHYVHPKHFRASNFWLSVVLHGIYILLTVLLATAWIIFSFQILLPLCSLLMYVALNEFTQSFVSALPYFLYSVGSCFLLLLGSYLIVKLMKRTII